MLSRRRAGALNSGHRDGYAGVLLVTVTETTLSYCDRQREGDSGSNDIKSRAYTAVPAEFAPP